MVNKPQYRKSRTTINVYYAKNIGPKEYDLYTQKIQKAQEYTGALKYTSVERLTTSMKIILQLDTILPFYKSKGMTRQIQEMPNLVSRTLLIFNQTIESTEWKTHIIMNTT